MGASILIITGPPGVGKTTASAHIAASFDPSAVVRADDFFDYLATGFVPPHLPASHPQNVRVIDITVRAAAGYEAGGWTTVLEGIIGPWFLDAATAAAHAVDAELHYAILMAPLETCLGRFVDREGSDQRTDVVRKMHAEFVAHELPRHLIDATGSIAGTAQAALERFDGGALEVGS